MSWMELSGIMLILIFIALGIDALCVPRESGKGHLSKLWPKTKNLRVIGPTRETGCDLCSGNCGQCGSSHAPDAHLTKKERT